MNEPRWSKRVEYDSSLQWLIMHGLEVSPGVASLMEQSIATRFDWINSVQVNTHGNANRQVMINLGLTREFQEAEASTQQSSFYGLIELAANSVGWRMEGIGLDYKRYASRPFPV